MPVKLQTFLPTLTTYEDFVEARAQSTERKPLRMSKNPKLYRWEYVLRHKGVCTFADIDSEMKKVVAPGLNWLVDGNQLTVVTPYILSGGALSVVMVKTPLLKRLIYGCLVDQGPDKPKVRVTEELVPGHCISMSVSDLFQNSTPYPTGY